VRDPRSITRTKEEKKKRKGKEKSMVCFQEEEVSCMKYEMLLLCHDEDRIGQRT
jgi:hypothetical protein